MILLDSVFINNSGGKVLLDYLVKELEFNKIDVFYLFDQRCSEEYNEICGSRKKYIKASLFRRHIFYIENRSKFSKIFCFGNIPPTIRLNVPVFTYFHNVSLLEQPSTYSIKEKVIKKVKSLIITYFSCNTDFLLVQTKDVKNLVSRKVQFPENRCLILPFYEIKETSYSRTNYDSFVFVSNGNTHKNHKNLISAWEILAKRNIFPELHLTITDNFIELTSIIEAVRKKGCKIINHGYTDAYKLYSKCNYLIYPSLCESFGLGLAEAVECGCKVLAADLPYVHHVINPTAVFDPLDPKAIADSVEEVLNGENDKSTTLIVENKVKELLQLIK